MSLTILVADDSATMRSVLEKTFAGEGARVIAVDSGAALLARAPEVKPDVIIADASLDGTDAYQIATAIRANPALASIPVIVLASQHTPYDDERGRAAGVADHVLKPFDTAQMIERITKAASGGARSPSSVIPAAPTAVRPAVPPPSASRPASVLPPSVTVPTPAAAPARNPLRQTVAFGSMPIPTATTAPAPAARPAAPPAPLAPQARPVTTAPPARTSIHPLTAPPAPIEDASLGRAVEAAMAPKLASLGLTREQAEGVLKISREVIERVAWEVVPDLAETIIREEIRRLTQG